MAANQRGNTRERKASAPGKRPQETSDLQTQTSAESAIGTMRDDVSEYMSRGASHLRDMTRDHEGTTVLVALAAGFGVGVAIGCILAPGHSRPRSWTDRITAEGVGRRLLDRIEGLIPDALAERIGR